MAGASSSGSVGKGKGNVGGFDGFCGMRQKFAKGFNDDFCSFSCEICGAFLTGAGAGVAGGFEAADIAIPGMPDGQSLRIRS